MKTIARIVVMLMLTYGIVSLTSCTNSSKNDMAQVEVEENFEDEREQLEDELLELQDNINNKLEAIEDKSEEATDEVRSKLADVREKLERDRNDVQVILNNVSQASAETWSDVREGARNTFQDVKKEVGELSTQLTEVFESE